MSGAVFSETAPLLAFRPLNLYRTHVLRRDLKDEIYLRFSASGQLNDFVIKLRSKIVFAPFKNYSALKLFYFRKICRIFRDFLIGRDIVAHFTFMEFLISNHIKISCSGKTEYNCLFFARFLAF